MRSAASRISRFTASVMFGRAFLIARKDVRPPPPSQLPSNGRLPLRERRRYDAPSMSLLVALVATAAVVALWFRYERERQTSALAFGALEERVRQLTMRMDVAEHDAVAASAQAEVAERLLLEKGYADADDLEAVRRRLEGEFANARVRDGELN
jgi:hypothetical protein